MEEKRKSELEWLKNRLKNISPINRTLCLARLPKNRVFALSNLDEFEEFKSYELLTKLLDGERSLRLAPVSAPQEQFTESDEPPPLTRITRSLTTLFRENESLIRNKGDAFFHLGFPFLEFYTKNDNYFRAPLFLFPCSLKKEAIAGKVKKLTWIVEIDAEPSLNELIFDAIEKGNGFKFDSDEIGKLKDLCDSMNLKNLISKTLDFLKKSDFVIEGGLVEKELYTDKNGSYLTKEELQNRLNVSNNKQEKYDKVILSVCEPINQIKKDELPPKKNLNLKLLNYAVIGQFPTYSSTLIKDYEEYLNNVQSMKDPIVDQIILGNCSEEENINPISDENLRNAIQVAEKDRYFVLPANSTQEQIVLSLRELKQTGFVADGPPGTGKSQLIVNIVADNLALGKKVLVCCEKRAALDVVYKRLQGAGLKDHVILIHSPEKERDRVFQEILDTIEKSEKTTAKKLKLLKQNFEAMSADIEEDLQYLNEYSNELHQERENGLSLFEMYSKALAKCARINLDPALCEKFAFSEFEIFINKISKILGDAEKYYALKMPPSIKLNDSVNFNQVQVLIESMDNFKGLYEKYSVERKNIEQYAFKNDLDLEDIRKKKNSLSECINLARKLDREDAVLKLLRDDITPEVIEEKICVLNSLLGHLPEDFRELPISWDTIENDCETINRYRKLFFETQNKIISPATLFKKFCSQVGSHGLFNKLTHYRITPLLHEDTLEICKYVEANKDLLKKIFESEEIISYRKHKDEIERFLTNINTENVLNKAIGIAVWEEILQKSNYLRAKQKDALRFFIPKWHKNKKEVIAFLKENFSVTFDSLDKCESLINSNIHYLKLKDYIKPLYSDLEISALSDFSQIYSSVELFKTVMKAIEALQSLYQVYCDHAQQEGISLIESHRKFEDLANKYGITSDIKPEKFLSDLVASQIIKKNNGIFDYFKQFEGFPSPIINKSLQRFIGNLTAQVDVYKKMAVIKDDFDMVFSNDANLDSELMKFIKIYENLENYVLLTDRFFADFIKLQDNFTDGTKQLLRSTIDEKDDFLSLLNDIKYYLANYDAERQWYDISSHLNDTERQTIMNLCELKSDDPHGEMVISYCKYWINKLENENTKLRNFNDSVYELKRSNLNSKLDEKRNICADYIACSIKKNGSKVAYNAQLIHDLRLKRRKKSVCYVFKKYFEEIQNLFPVALMSPENVSQCLPNKTDLFDLVIFDEASQIEVYKAIPAVFRGESLFVTGDEHQLPPNRVGVTVYDDSNLPENYDPDNMDLQETLDFRAAESFLDQCISRFCKYSEQNCLRLGRKMLDWHYRSEYEALINFSNHAFYKGQIQISPDPGQYRNYRCIRYHKVSGFFIKRRNIIEAQAVVQLLRKFWLSNANGRVPTIGVVTFSLEQQNAIWDEIDRECVSNQAFGEAYQKELSRKEGEEDIGFFIRNIENVQGDERDIIIFSIGYGPKAPGEKIEMQFGVFSREKGENRLNVAITRAKKEVHIVASIEPEELRVEATSHRGPKLLQEYLRYCRLVDNSKLSESKRLLFGMSSLQVSSGDNVLSFDSEFEQEVFNFLESKGYVVATQVGCSRYRIDLAIVDPHYNGRYLCGIECDGASYHSGIDARERDIYRQSFLESKNWKILRIWSSYWFRNQEDAKNKLINLIEALILESKNNSLKHAEIIQEEVKPVEDSVRTVSEGKIKADPETIRNNNILNPCPECGSEYKVATNGYFYSFYCPTCQWQKTADLDDLKPFIEEKIFCKKHPTIKLKPKKSVRGLFLTCPSCYYVESLKIKERFLYCPADKKGQKKFFL